MTDLMISTMLSIQHKKRTMTLKASVLNLRIQQLRIELQQADLDSIKAVEEELLELQELIRDQQLATLRALLKLGYRKQLWDH